MNVELLASVASIRISRGRRRATSTAVTMRTRSTVSSLEDEIRAYIAKLESQRREREGSD